LTPGFALISHHKMIISVKIDCVVQKLDQNYLLFIHSFTLTIMTTRTFSDRNCCKVYIIIIQIGENDGIIRSLKHKLSINQIQLSLFTHNNMKCAVFIAIKKPYQVTMFLLSITFLYFVALCRVFFKIITQTFPKKLYTTLAQFPNLSLKSYKIISAKNTFF